MFLFHKNVFNNANFINLFFCNIILSERAISRLTLNLTGINPGYALSGGSSPLPIPTSYLPSLRLAFLLTGWVDMIKDYLEALKEGCIELGNTVFFYVHLINTSRTDCENEHWI